MPYGNSVPYSFPLSCISYSLYPYSFLLPIGIRCLLVTASFLLGIVSLLSNLLDSVTLSYWYYLVSYLHGDRPDAPWNGYDGGGLGVGNDSLLTPTPLPSYHRTCLHWHYPFSFPHISPLLDGSSRSVSWEWGGVKVLCPTTYPFPAFRIDAFSMVSSLVSSMVLSSS